MAVLTPPKWVASARSRENQMNKDPLLLTTQEAETLLAVATIYVDSFRDDETMTLPERMRLQEVEDVLERHGRRY